jgi:molybdopterin-guanine dinucleotide biosynthesis adapter protein
MKVLQIVGYKNSGKTTISKEVIAYFSSKHIKVGSLKHHGHGGIPHGLESTDSEQHRKAGAGVAGVWGENLFQLVQDNWDIADMLLIYEHLKIEFLVLEGFKKMAYPKLVLLRNQDDISLLASLENIIGIIKPNKLHVDSSTIPVFDLERPSLISEWVYQHYLRGGIR